MIYRFYNSYFDKTVIYICDVKLLEAWELAKYCKEFCLTCQERCLLTCKECYLTTWQGVVFNNISPNTHENILSTLMQISFFLSFKYLRNKSYTTIYILLTNLPPYPFQKHLTRIITFLFLHILSKSFCQCFLYFDTGLQLTWCFRSLILVLLQKLSKIKIQFFIRSGPRNSPCKYKIKALGPSILSRYLVQETFTYLIT